MASSLSQDRSDLDIDPGLENFRERDRPALRSSALAEYYARTVDEKGSQLVEVRRANLEASPSTGEGENVGRTQQIELKLAPSLSSSTVPVSRLRFFDPTDILQGYVTRREGDTFVAVIFSETKQAFEYSFDADHLPPNQRAHLKVGAALTVAAGDEYERGTKYNKAKVFLHYSKMPREINKVIASNIASKWKF